MAGLPVATSFEPALALDGGSNGLGVIEQLLARLPGEPGTAVAIAYLEIGADQGEAIVELSWRPRCRAGPVPSGRTSPACPGSRWWPATDASRGGLGAVRHHQDVPDAYRLPTFPIRLIALDIDGTLVGDDLVDGTTHAHGDPGGHGPRRVSISLVTGRMVSSAMRFARELGLTAPVVGYQGGLIREMTAARIGSRLGKLLVHLPLAADVARDVVRVDGRERSRSARQPPRTVHPATGRPECRRLLGVHGRPRRIPRGPAPTSTTRSPRSWRSAGRPCRWTSRRRPGSVLGSGGCHDQSSEVPRIRRARRLQGPGGPVPGSAPGRAARGHPGDRRSVERRGDAGRGRSWGGDADRAGGCEGSRPIHRAARRGRRRGHDDRVARARRSARRPRGRRTAGATKRMRARVAGSRDGRAGPGRHAAAIVAADEAGSRAAADALRNGGVVALPTDTVYGIAVALPTPGGIERLFEVKRRPPDKGIMLLLADACPGADDRGHDARGDRPRCRALARRPDGHRAAAGGRAVARGPDRWRPDDRPSRAGPRHAPGARRGRRPAADDVGQPLWISPRRGMRPRSRPRSATTSTSSWTAAWPTAALPRPSWTAPAGWRAILRAGAVPPAPDRGHPRCGRDPARDRPVGPRVTTI